jgi:hypothetical protein
VGARVLVAHRIFYPRGPLSPGGLAQAGRRSRREERTAARKGFHRRLRRLLSEEGYLARW